MTVESSKNLAGVGSILLFLPFVNIVGLILVLIGVKDLSEYYKDSSMYQNAIKGLIFSVIGTICSGLAFSALFGFSVFGGIGGWLLGIGLGLLLIVVAFVFQILAALSIKKTFYSLSDRSGEHLFHTTGTLFFIGAILTIILVGFFLIAISFILAAVAFFSIKTSPNTPSYNYTSSSPSQSAEQSYQTTSASNIKSNFCPNCGSAVAPDASFCANCGKQI
jgi:uncharacterized membrane protein